MRKILIMMSLIIMVSCQNPVDNNYVEENHSSEIIEDDYNENYLFNYDYISFKGFEWYNFDVSKFYGTWESINEIFIFNNDYTYKYWENKNTVEPELFGMFGEMNNGKDLSCTVYDNNKGWRIKIFTPFNFIDENTLYLGFQNNGVQFIRVDKINDINVSDDNGTDNNDSGLNNDIETDVDYSYLMLDETLDINNVLNFYVEVEYKMDDFEGTWESEDGEILKFEINYLSYWNKNSDVSPTIEGYIFYSYLKYNTLYLCVRDGFSESIFVFTTFKFINEDLYLDIEKINKKYSRVDNI